MILSIDFGTSSIKMSLLDNDLNTLQYSREEYPYVLGRNRQVEMEPARLLGALRTACERLDVRMLARVDQVCYDTFSPSLILMDENGTPLHNIVTHLDRRSHEQSIFICERFGRENYHRITGVYPFNGGVSLTTLLWFMQQKPELMDRVSKIGHLTTYLQKQFTGTWAVDMVNASMMGLYDTVNQSGWSEEIISAFDIPRKWLSPILVPGTNTGGLLPEMAELLRIPAGVPVSMGTNDMATAQVGAANTRPGQILNTAGSSDMVSILTDKPVISPNYYLRNSAIPGLWQIYATTSGGFSIDWFYREFCKDMDAEYFYTEYIPSCIEIGEDNPVTFDPYLAGDRQSMDSKTGSWHGLSLSSTREQMMSALLYSMQRVLHSTILSVSDSVSVDKTIKITGGMVNDSILSLKSRVFRDFRFQVCDDCNIIGNTLLAR